MKYGHTVEMAVCSFFVPAFAKSYCFFEGVMIIYI